jgi:thiosulfate reductase/polysulfide reductase chain A
MQNLELMVVVDVIPSEIAGWADVVLPETIYLERYDDLNVEWFRDPFVALRQPVVDPPDEQKPNWWIAKRLAEKLGLGHYFPWNDIQEYLRYRVEAAGLDWEELRRTGIIRGAKQPTTFDEGVPAEFATPTGKIEFYSPQLAEAGFDPMPLYEPVPEPPPGYFRLLYGRSPVHSFSRTHTNPVLMDMVNENDLWIHPMMASRFGVHTGDYVRLKNQDGVVSDRIRVLATERIRPDCVYMVHGFGHTSRQLRRAYRRGASDAGLITHYATDPLMGGTGMNVNFVTLHTEEG